MARVTRIPNSRFPRKPPRGGGKPGPKPTGARPDRSIQVGMFRNTKGTAK